MKNNIYDSFINLISFCLAIAFTVYCFTGNEKNQTKLEKSNICIVKTNKDGSVTQVVDYIEKNYSDPIFCQWSKLKSGKNNDNLGVGVKFLAKNIYKKFQLFNMWFLLKPNGVIIDIQPNMPEEDILIYGPDKSSQ